MTKRIPIRKLNANLSLAFWVSPNVSHSLASCKRDRSGWIGSAGKMADLIRYGVDSLRTLAKN